MSSVLDEVAAERRKQREKWGTAHDDEHLFGELAIIAAELAVEGTDARIECSADWFERDFWGLMAKHKCGRQKLVIAAALLIAEIERMDRCEARGELG